MKPLFPAGISQPRTAYSGPTMNWLLDELARDAAKKMAARIDKEILFEMKQSQVLYDDPPFPPIPRSTRKDR